jgi:hypothetical protein
MKQIDTAHDGNQTVPVPQEKTWLITASVRSIKRPATYVTYEFLVNAVNEDSAEAKAQEALHEEFGSDWCITSVDQEND